ncbi:Spy/CpxP family protein refolding chaperone [Fluoribacter gormanii]|uniref:Spy/CpxP family protein refolding chaperone n=1 Tax=Fluoribacter gormanii TaxID=464 RepID=UPI0022433541|nr:Spy/CpxP family protein refolding chaperone [Fluoribacter gormanii]MCW8443694.1 Spy/CpxP family protein refolding chaperone [Fluoribacter gormanii]MCW8472123.1 Spy/CpxP family protein refolding chaperone [Fluoribacter gormanii]
MNKKLIWLATLALVLSLGQPSFACIGDLKHCNSHHQFDKLAQELNLSADQKAKLKAYKEKAKVDFKENYAQLRLLRSQINSLVKTDKIDEAKLDALIEKVNKIRASMLKSKIMTQHQMFALLNDNQKAKFLELKKKWFMKHND